MYRTRLVPNRANPRNSKFSDPPTPPPKCLIFGRPPLAPIMHSEAQNWSGGRVWVLAAQPTSAERTRRPFITRYVHPQWPETAILAEIRGNNREKRVVDGRESLSRRPRPPGCTTRPKKTGSRDSTIISLALHTMYSVSGRRAPPSGRELQRGAKLRRRLRAARVELALQRQLARLARELEREADDAARAPPPFDALPGAELA